MLLSRQITKHSIPSSANSSKNDSTPEKSKEVKNKEAKSKKARSREQQELATHAKDSFMDMTIPLNFDEIACSICDNKFLNDFINKYRYMDNTHMHKLKDGTYLEERMFRFGLTCKYEHLCHSFIFGPKDYTYVQKGVLTPEQVEEIVGTTPVQLPQLDDDLVDYLMKFSQVQNVDGLRRALYENSTYKLDLKDEKTNCLIGCIDLLTISHCYMKTKILSLQITLSNGFKHGFGFPLISCLKISKVLLAFAEKTVVSLEYVCQESKGLEDDTKVLEERHFKVAKEMKDILWSLMKFSDFATEKIKNLVSIGITTFEFKAYFDICDMKLGYVARITRSKEFVVQAP
ncbi:hypothetical protein CLU79DRAFT_40349 [Phycomyces nitens]|nr:hypothetical protein CLU79DRAFT_40349 [Phycomyces nitens]